MEIILIESIVLCLLFTATVIIGTKKNPLGGLHNLPKPIQMRVNSMPEYSSQQREILSTQKRIIKKLPALVVVLLIFTGLIWLAGARSFFQGFLYSFVLWTIIKLYVTFILNCGWYAHTPSAWVKGTEDMKSEYQNYGFYIRTIPRSLLAGSFISVIIGLFITLVV